MSNEVKNLNDQQAASVSGGASNGVWCDTGVAPHARGVSWLEGGAVMYGIVADDYLGNIAQRFGTSVGAIQSLNPGKIKNVNVIRANDTIRVR